MARLDGSYSCLHESNQLCSSTRPTLFTTPALLFPDSDPQGFHCMMTMTMQASPPNCTTLSAMFPPVKNSTISPVLHSSCVTILVSLESMSQIWDKLISHGVKLSLMSHNAEMPAKWSGDELICFGIEGRTFCTPVYPLHGVARVLWKQANFP